MEEIDKEVNIIEVEKPKKKRKFLKFLIIFLITAATIVFLLGFIFPGLLWTKDLGIKYSEADYNSAILKLQYIKDVAPDGTSVVDYNYVYGPVVAVNISLTSEEITAFINTGRPSYYAVKNVQVKINSDGTIDATGNVNVDYVLNEILGGKYSRSEIVKEIPALGILPSTVNLALNFSGSIINNASSVDINDVSVQGIPIPNDLVQSNEAISTVTDGINKFVSKRNIVTGSTVNKIAAENGKLLIDGKFPSSLSRIKK